jgi:hypothetical protein
MFVSCWFSGGLGVEDLGVEENLNRQMVVFFALQASSVPPVCDLLFFERDGSDREVGQEKQKFSWFQFSHTALIIILRP